jgi:hypothetical protein
VGVLFESELSVSLSLDLFLNDRLLELRSRLDRLLEEETDLFD